MNELMNILASKEPHYVRCVKPNEIKSSTKMDKERVIHQISYLGKAMQNCDRNFNARIFKIRERTIFQRIYPMTL